MSAYENPPGLNYEDRWDLETALSLLEGALSGDWEDERIDGDYVCRWMDEALWGLAKRKGESCCKFHWTGGPDNYACGGDRFKGAYNGLGNKA